jgi:hypothetical protein
MEKKQYIEKLKAELIRRGYNPADVEAEMIPVNSYFEENSITDVPIPLEEMVSEVCEILDSRSGAAPAKKPISAEDEIESALRAETEDSPDSAGGEKSSDTGSASGPEEPKEEGRGEGGDGEPEEPVDDIEEYSPDSGEKKVKLPSFLEKLLVRLKRGKKKPEESAGGEWADYEKDYPDGKSRALYWLIVIICIPFIIALALVAIGIYIAFWLVLALLMIFTIAALIVFVTAGAVVSVVGIVYGIIQVIKGMTPVGLFEIGLGITVGAAVIFVGILIYNFAVRLIPFAMKQLARLLGFAFRRTKEGFAAIKRTLDEA